MARCDHVVDTLATSAGTALLAGSRAVMLRGRLEVRHAQIERLRAERERLRHQPTPTLDKQLCAALLAFHTDAAALLGFDDDNEEREGDDG